jgi:hypothetical protein
MSTCYERSTAWRTPYATEFSAWHSLRLLRGTYAITCNVYIAIISISKERTVQRATVETEPKKHWRQSRLTWITQRQAASTVLCLRCKLLQAGVNSHYHYVHYSSTTAH